MFKALNRKTSTRAPNTTESDTLTSSMSRSKPTSAVNCMDLALNLTSISVLKHNSNNNSSDVYADINVHDDLNLATLPSSNTNGFLPITIQPIDHSHYVNDPSTSNTPPTLVKPVNEKVSIFEIDMSEVNIPSQLMPMQYMPQIYDLAETPATDTQFIPFNHADQDISASFKKKHALDEQKTLADISFESDTDGSSNSMNVIKKSNLKKHFKFKLKSAFQFSKRSKVCCQMHSDEFSLEKLAC